MRDPSKVLMSTPGRAYGDGEVYPRLRGLGALVKPSPFGPKATTMPVPAPKPQSSYGEAASGPVPTSTRAELTRQVKQLEDVEPPSTRAAMAISLGNQLDRIVLRWADSSWWDGYWSWPELRNEARRWSFVSAQEVQQGAGSSITRSAPPASGQASTADSIANLVNSLAGPARDVAATIAAKSSPQTFAAVPPPSRSTAATALGLAAAAVAVVGLVALAKGR